MVEDDWVTTDVAAGELGLERASVLQAIRDGKLTARKLGRMWFIAPVEVDRYRIEHLGRKGWSARRQRRADKE